MNTPGNLSLNAVESDLKQSLASRNFFKTVHLCTDEKKSQEEMKASHFHTKKRQALAEQKKNLSLEDRDDSKDINTAHHGNTSTDTATDNAQE